MLLGSKLVKLFLQKNLLKGKDKQRIKSDISSERGFIHVDEMLYFVFEAMGIAIL